MILLLQVIAVVLAGLLTVSILLQARGTGLGAVFGGSDNVYRTKRGVEKLLFRGTIIGTVIFFSVSLLVFLLMR